MGGRIQALDGARGLAILLVVGFHASVIPGGWVGVSLFFALSGYLITTLLLAEHDRTGTIALPSFYWRRAIRLGPALLVALAGMWLIWAYLGQSRLVSLNVAVALLYVANIVRAALIGQMLPAGWAWTLSLEEQFYALWPLLLRRLLRQLSRGRIAALLLLPIVAVQAERLLLGENWANVSYTLLRGDELLLGAMLALTAWRCPRWLSWLGLSMFTALVLLPEGHVAVTITGAAISSAVIVASVHSHPRLAALFSLHPLRYLGRVSYALYLWNGVLTDAWVFHHGTPSGMSALFLTALALALAACSTHFVEEPLRRRLARGQQRQPATGLVAQAAAQCTAMRVPESVVP